MKLTAKQIKRMAELSGMAKRSDEEEAELKGLLVLAEDQGKEEAKTLAMSEITKGIKEGVEEGTKELVATIEVLEKRTKELETANAGRPKWNGKVPGVDEEMIATGKELSIVKIVNAQIEGDWKGAEFEKEVIDEFVKVRTKELGTGTGSAGGVLVPTAHIPQLIELLRAQTTVVQMGATLMPGLTESPVEIPKQSAAAIATWVDENAAIAPSDSTYGQVTMTPNQLSGLVKISRRLIRQSSPAIEGIVRADLTKQIARALDLAALRGSGIGAEPLGIANTGGISTVAHGGAISYDKLAEHIFELEDSDGMGEGAGWIMSPKLKFAISKLKDGDARPLFQWDPAQKVPQNSLLGFPWITTTQLPTDLGGGNNETELFFADWSQLLIGEWFALEIASSMETSDAFAKNQVWIRAIQEADIALRHEESFTLSTGLTV